MKFDFYRSLRKKTQVDPSAGFDQRFWSRFDAEFPPKPSFFQKFFSMLHGLPKVPVFATAMLILVGGALFFTSRSNVDPLVVDAAPVLDSLDLLEDLEFAEDLEDDLLVLADDEDWQELLQEESDET